MALGRAHHWQQTRVAPSLTPLCVQVEVGIVLPGGLCHAWLMDTSTPASGPRGAYREVGCEGAGGDSPRPVKDELLQEHSPRMFSLIKNESWGLEEN